MTIDLNSLPDCIDGPGAWLGPDMILNPDRWLVHLAPVDIAELEAAAQHFLALGRDVGEITVEDFPLPQFSRHLKSCRRNCATETA